MNFQIIVLTIALLLLVASLVFIGYALYTNRFSKKFPPVIAECPDFWIAKNDKCENPENLGNCTGPMDFNSNKFKGNNGDCEKSKWARSCGVSWTGITNNSKVCDTDN